MCALAPVSLVAQSSALTGFDLPARGSATWRTLETEHFTFHYLAEFEEWTLSVASRMESVRNAVRDYVGHAPTPKITVLVDDPRNVANGNAIPWLDRPQLQLFPVPPGPRSFGRMRSWGELLAVHEFGHLAHLSRPGRGAPWFQRLAPLMGIQGPLPQRLPRWATEGYATVIEGALTGAGRPSSAMRAAILRQFAADGLLPDFGSINGTSGFLGGNFAYLLGSAFLEHLAATHGDSTLPHLWRRLSAVTSRSFPAAFEQTFGERPDDAYAKYIARLVANAVQMEDALERVGRIDGTLEVKGTGSLGDPAVSPDASKIAIALPGQSGAQGRLVVWPSAPPSQAERDSVRRVAAERLLKADSLDVPPVEQLPRSRRVLATLRPARGAEYASPRFFADNERVLVARWDMRSDGTTIPDLYIWNSRTGDVRRVTHGAAVREGDPFPDGERAAGLRCGGGHCDIVIVDLRSGDVRTLRAGSAFVQYARPRVSPDGRRIAASELRDGVWRAVLIDATTGDVMRVGPDDRTNRYDFAWSADGRTLFGVSDANGVPNVERIDVESGRTRPLTRVFGAALAPAPVGGDTLFFLSLTGRGYDLRRLVVDTTVDVAGVPGEFYDLARGAIVTQLGGDAPTFDSTDVRGPRRYGLGPQRIAWLPFGGGSIGGGFVGLSLFGMDPNERFTWLVQHAWRHDRPSNSGTSAQGILRVASLELSAEAVRSYVLGAHWTGGAASLSHARVDKLGLTGVRTGYAMHNVEPELGDVTDNRNYLWGALERTFVFWRGRNALIIDVDGHASRTTHDLSDDAESSDARHLIGSVAAQYRAGSDAVLQWETTAGRLEDGSTLDHFALGGLGMRVINPAVVPQSVAVPWLEPGTLTGSSFTQHVLRLGPTSGGAFAWAVRTDAGEWQRAVGLEARLQMGAEGFSRLPGVSAIAGAAWLFDRPNADRVRVWAGLSFRP